MNADTLIEYNRRRVMRAIFNQDKKNRRNHGLYCPYTRMEDLPSPQIDCLEAFADWCISKGLKV